MVELQRLYPELTIDILTTAPQEIFEQTGVRNARYLRHIVDLGLVQRSATEEDIPKTIESLGALYPLSDSFIAGTIALFGNRRPQLIVGDIAPCATIVAKHLGIPSIIVQNFTWPWIYAGYEDREPRFRRFIDYLETLFRAATLTIVAEPGCVPRQDLPENTIVVPPVARRPRMDRQSVREKIGAPENKPLVLLSMGGMPLELPFLEQLHHHEELFWVVGASVSTIQRNRNVLLFPPQSELYHPDLVQAADVVVSKLGYSTVAETVTYGTRLAAVERPQFREHHVLSSFVRDRVRTNEISEQSFWQGTWIPGMLELLSQPPLHSPAPGLGATAAAEAIARCT